MAIEGRKDALISDNNKTPKKKNEEEKEAILPNEAQKNTSQGLENEGGENTGDEEENRKRQKKKKKKSKKPSNDEESTYYNSTNQNQGVMKRPLPEIPPQGNSKVKAINTATQTEGICTEKRDTSNSLQKQHYTLDKKSTVESRASSIILGLKGIIMIAVIVLISSSEEISKTKSCDLEKALKSISLNYTVPCKYDDIKEVSTTLRNLGISLLAVNFLFFLLTFVFLLLPQICKLVVCILFSLVAIFSVFMIMEHNDILYSKTAEKDMNYVQLQSTMAIWLEAHYTSDNISSSDVISNSWNKFFIEYDCCAVNQVTGTTNDFDSTPWCTTSGSCQTTASQIPKTCCNYMSEDDYGSAPTTCHSSVNSGTFRSNCMNVIKQLSVVNVEECQLSLLQMSLIIIGTLELVATAFEIMAVIIWMILWFLNKPSPIKEDNL